MIANASANGDLIDRVLDAIEEVDPEKKMHLTDAEKVKVYEGLEKEGGLMSDEFRAFVAGLFDREADYLEEREGRKARAVVMDEVLAKPTPALIAIAKKTAADQRKIADDFTASADTMKIEATAYGEGQARAKQNVEEATYRAQSDADAEEIRRMLQEGPENQIAA